MKNACFALAFLIVCVGMVPVMASAQTITDPQIVRQQLSGQHLQITYSGGIYQYSYFLSVHYCASGKYFTNGQNSRTTILGNHEEHNWTDYGSWDVISVQDQSYLSYVSSVSGEKNAVPFALSSDGRFLAQGLNITIMGRAQCK